jgi:hypothetical protein
MILKILSPKNRRKNWRFWLKNTAELKSGPLHWFLRKLIFLHIIGENRQKL